jgi:hypothetical protein
VTSPIIQLQGLTSQTSNSVLIFNGETTQKLKIVAYRFPTSSELVVTPERQNTFGYISGTGLDYSTKSATYVTPSGFTMDPGYGKCVADGTNIACKIETLPPGSYDVTVNAPFFAAGGSSGNQSCYWGISDGIQVDVATGQTLTPVTAGSYDGISAVSRQFTYASVRSNIIFKLIVKELSSGGASANCSIATSNSRYWAMKVTPLNQPSNSALYVQGPVLSGQTGSVLPVGYIGEIITSASSATGTFANGVVTQNVGTLTLTPGTWLVSAGIEFGVTNSYNSNAISISATSATMDGTSTTQPQAGVAGAYTSFGSIFKIIRVNTNTTVYAVTRTWIPTGTNAYANMAFSAIRIGSN